MASSWTEERLKLLKKLWQEGKTASTIASELGGITRNAVIGKAHRMGLSGRPSPIIKKNTTQKKAPTQKHGLSILEISHSTCAWPIGDPRHGNFHFCGKGVMEERPYCEDHTMQAYHKVRRNKGASKSQEKRAAAARNAA